MSKLMVCAPLSCEPSWKRCVDVSQFLYKHNEFYETSNESRRSYSKQLLPDSRMPSNRSRSCLAIALILCYVMICNGAASGARCKLKKHTHKAIQTDFNGLRCWDEVKIKSCWGYCLSYEISHWQFPYKESHHPVCVHGERRHASVRLRNCDPGVQPGTDLYHYVEAASCKCQACSSDDTSCEWLPPDSSLLGGLMLAEDSDETE